MCLCLNCGLVECCLSVVFFVFLIVFCLEVCIYCVVCMCWCVWFIVIFVDVRILVVCDVLFGFVLVVLDDVLDGFVIGE